MQAITLFATSDAQTDARVNNSSVWVQALPVMATAGTQTSGMARARRRPPRRWSYVSSGPRCAGATARRRPSRAQRATSERDSAGKQLVTDTTRDDVMRLAR